MNYNLNKLAETTLTKEGNITALKKLWPIVAAEKVVISVALVAILANAFLNLLAPRLAAHVIDTYIPAHNFQGVLQYAALILGLYLGAFVLSYLQTRLMGGVGQRVLFNVRNSIFNKLQELPVAFFNQNKAGDLISRINNDTDKLNQFFSQALMQFIGSVFIMIGAGIFLVSIHWQLGLATLAPAGVLVIFTRLISPWVKRKNKVNMDSLGGMSAEIQESLDNFRVIVAFNRRDYFKQRFQSVNEQNYGAAVGAGLANNIFTPTYGLASNVGQLIVLAYGIYLIASGQFTIGLLISFLAYANNFYNPLRQLAALWANFQAALASWDRISAILSLHSDLVAIPDMTTEATETLLEFKDVAFKYADGKEVLHNVNFTLEPGKTYALVGPTGGGKTTTASLMARLYDPTQGIIKLRGRDIRSYDPTERAQKIGFILQEPILFTGTLRDNILYGQTDSQNYTNEQLTEALDKAGLATLLTRFDQGLDTPVSAAGDSISLGQKQLVAFIRAALRQPELLILDEATANIDTVTEQLLEEILTKLPTTTTRVIIAHRLNTIENADEIFFVNAGEVIKAGSMEHAVDMLLHGQRQT